MFCGHSELKEKKNPHTSYYDLKAWFLFTVNCRHTIKVQLAWKIILSHSCDPKPSLLVTFTSPLVHCLACMQTEVNGATQQHSARCANAFKLWGLRVHIKLIRVCGGDYGVLQARHRRPVAGVSPHSQKPVRKWEKVLKTVSHPPAVHWKWSFRAALRKMYADKPLWQ